MKKNRIPMTYKREKDKVEISGDPADVKPMIWYDIITSLLTQKLWQILFFFKAPFATTIPPLWTWIKNKLH